ncbi:MAG: ABC transporter ATP-binding protein/permease [Clostridia bacterium]|jgi:putative ABC transport system permease protein|nr:ABC transporter ATP-binding protein/permease [Clostridia bacterium]
MLKLLDITKEYIVEKESTLALRGVSIEFRKNEFVSILGPSGCGKTTLLNIIGGLDRYTAGDIQIDGISTKQYDDVDWDTYRNRKIGFVFQSYNLIPHMNILKNVAMSLTLAGVDREERRERALEALRKVGLENQARKRPNQLSGGQMQRVAIARALVNNPDIILADEPTGALDSESGIQVMDLLKEVAEDRLVIMVTHNPMLAEEYSTRIVYLKDGEVEGDTMPYNSDEEGKAEDNNNDLGGGADGTSLELFGNGEAKEGAEAVAIADAMPDVDVAAPVKKKSRSCERFEKLKRFLWKRRQLDKSAMKLSTAISLSWNNLLSKKGRTLLTSIAGSIGIIGIILVLSLSNGAKLYIRNLEESALSTYPLTVNKTNMDITSIMNMLMGGNNKGDGKFDEGTITTEQVLGGVLSNLTSLTKENDLHSLKKYIDGNFDSDLASVKYNYGTTFNAFAEDPANEKEPDETKHKYMKVNPYSEMMYSVFDEVVEEMDWLKDLTVNIMGQEMNINDMLGYLAGMVGESWAEISDNQKLLNNQYDLVGNSRWPQKENEIVVVVNDNNTLLDFQLFMLGLKSTDDVIEAIKPGGNFSSATYKVDDLIGREMKIMTNADYLTDNGDGTWTMHDRSDLTMSYVDRNVMRFADGTDTVKVVGVVRPKPGVIATSINGVVGYSSKLTSYMLSYTENHPAVKAMMKAYNEAVAKNYKSYKSVISYSYKDVEKVVSYEIGDEVKFDKSQDHSMLMRQLGFVDVEYPISIDFYCSSFEAKEEIAAFLEQYQKDTKNTIKYTDSLSSMMSFVNTMADTITGVLVAFAAISLVVSTIMIAIIIYTSVLERRKEIGVLRSIGARKKDISRVFLAESAILGGYSGLIGIIISTIISFIGSAVLKLIFNIEGLMSITWWHCLMMMVISVFLSMFAGFIPARIASKKDPAIALRSE